MNIKITSKDGITLKTQGKYCTEDIKINVEVAGGATITKPGGWVGTPVPNTGTVEKVYFNTNLNIEEVVGLLDQLDYPSVEGMGGDRNYFLYSEDGTYQLGVIDYGDGYVIGNTNDNSAYFCTSESMSKYVGGFIGWNPDFNGEISINSNVLSSYLFNDYIYQIGVYNEQLSSLFSTTPFTQSSGETLTIEGEYDGSTLETKANTINIKSLIEQKKIPLEIKVNVEEGVLYKRYQLNKDYNIEVNGSSLTTYSVTLSDNDFNRFIEVCKMFNSNKPFIVSVTANIGNGEGTMSTSTIASVISDTDTTIITQIIFAMYSDMGMMFVVFDIDYENRVVYLSGVATTDDPNRVNIISQFLHMISGIDIQIPNN